MHTTLIVICIPGYSSSCSLTAEQKITVCIDEEAPQRIKLGRSIRLLHSWAKQLRLKNYKRLTLNLLCENLAKVVQGDKTLQSKEKQSRRKRRRSSRQPLTTTATLSTKDVVAKKRSTPDIKQVIPRVCVCGTDECKEAMIHYFREIHDCTWPDKFFPCLYVGIPKRPSSETSFKHSRPRAQVRSLVREEKSRRHKLFLSSSRNY